MSDIFTIFLSIELILFISLSISLILQDMKMIQFFLHFIFIVNILIMAIALILQGVLVC